jgi:hypothetical protein
MAIRLIALIAVSTVLSASALAQIPAPPVDAVIMDPVELVTLSVPMAESDSKRVKDAPASMPPLAPEAAYADDQFEQFDRSDLEFWWQRYREGQPRTAVHEGVLGRL